MPNRIRRLAAALATAGLLLALAHPAVAREYEIVDDPSAVPIWFDVLVMRPTGLVATVLGTVLYVFPVVPIMAITRPTDIAKPLGPLVGVPAKFTFMDPIGQHPL